MHKLFDFLLLADRNSPANQWLRENPLVLSAILGVIGGVVLFFGIAGLRSGASTDKYGNQMTGGMNMINSVARALFGALFVGAAIYIAIFGAW